MKVLKHETVGTLNYFTIEVVDKFIKVDKLLELVDNIEDYFDKDRNFDKDTFKEEILNPRTYLISIDGNKTTCTCKNELFRKTTCRHINYALEVLNETKDKSI